MPADSSSPMNHVFVDCENIHEIDPAVIGGRSVSFTLLLGATHKKLNVDLVEKLVEHAASVQLVRLTASGRNALDLTLAYYVGRMAVTDPSACFHIVSKDKGYDPLIAHLHSRKISARRHDDFSDLSFSTTSDAAGLLCEQVLTKALEQLRSNNPRPKKRKALESYLVSSCGKIARADVKVLIDKLCHDGHVEIGENGDVNYRL